MIKKIAIILVLIVAALFGYAAMQPKEMMIAREITIKAPPAKIFPHVNSSQKANEWMPWQESDPKAKMTYSGPNAGVGSTSSWESSGKMGIGKAEIIESVANRSVKTQLTYTKPMPMSQLAEISLSPTKEGTVVRWSVSGHSPFFCRVIGIFMNMEKMVGGEFEKGLAKLKSKVE